MFYAPWVPPQRDYQLYVPSGYQAGKTSPLVVMLHGCKEDPQVFADGTRMNRLAETHGFLVLYPRQDATSNPDRCWNWFDPFNQRRNMGEAAIIAGMVESVKQSYGVDRNRVYVAGMSAGGAMTSIMASCYADVFAAAAVHSGVEYKAATSPWSARSALEQKGKTEPAVAGYDAYKCSGSSRRLMPVLVIHGKADTRVNVQNADQIVEQFAQMSDYADDGEDNDTIRGAPTQTITENPHGGHSYTVMSYQYGGRLLLQKYIVNDLGHAWSGGDAKFPYNDPKGPDAGRIIWDFFSKHALNR